MDRLTTYIRIADLPAFVDDNSWFGYQRFDLGLQLHVQVPDFLLFLSQQRVVDGLAFFAVTR